MKDFLVVPRPWWLLPAGRVHPLWWAAVGALMLGLDYLTGLLTLAPASYVVPVILAAWYSGPWPALALTFCIPFVHVVMMVTLSPGLVDIAMLATTAVRAFIISFIGLWFVRLAEHERALDKRVKVLEGLLPICSFCKNIRNEAGEWERLEAFISKRSQAQFSHGLCPSCGKTHYGRLFTKTSA